jgi:flagellar motor switch protein FliN
MDKIKEEEMLTFPQRQVQSDAAGQEKSVAEIDMQQAQFQQLDSPSQTNSDREKRLDLLMGISLPISIELGRTDLEISNILELKRGSIIEFDKMASEPVDIVVNGKKMAEGEVVVIDKHFAIRVTSLVDTSERLKGLGQ